MKWKAVVRRDVCHAITFPLKSGPFILVHE
jgi:hypothetical protein